MITRKPNTTPETLFILVLMTIYIWLMAIILTRNNLFSISVATMAFMRMVWQDIRILTGGRKIYFITTAPYPDET